MREIRQSGSEGGGFEFNRFPLPLSSEIRTVPLFAAAMRFAGDCARLSRFVVNRQYI